MKSNYFFKRQAVLSTIFRKRKAFFRLTTAQLFNSLIKIIKLQLKHPSRLQGSCGYPTQTLDSTPKRRNLFLCLFIWLDYCITGLLQLGSLRTHKQLKQLSSIVSLKALKLAVIALLWSILLIPAQSSYALNVLKLGQMNALWDRNSPFQAGFNGGIDGSAAGYSNPVCTSFVPLVGSLVPQDQDQVRVGNTIFSRFNCPGAPATTNSGFGYTGLSRTGGEVIGNNFLSLGSLVHFNNPVFGFSNPLGDAYLEAEFVFKDLNNNQEIVLSPVYKVSLEETPNNPSSFPFGQCPYPGPVPGDNNQNPVNRDSTGAILCADRTVISQPNPVYATIGETTFAIDLTGFAQPDADGNCPVDPASTGGLSDSFVTGERENTTACVFGLVSPSTLQLTKRSIGGDETFNFYWQELSQLNATLGQPIAGTEVDQPVTTVSGTAQVMVEDVFNSGTFISDIPIAPGKWVLREDVSTMPAGWEFVSVECTTDDSNPDTSSFTTAPDPSNLEVTLDMDTSETMGCTFTNRTRDWGDLNDVFGTTSASNGPSHGTNDLLFLGTTAGDGDLDGAPSNDARGDDDHDGIGQAPLYPVDDEDGITFPIYSENDPVYTVNASVTNKTSSTATLCGWIDFDNSRSFDEDEKACQSIPNSNSIQTRQLTFVIPTGDLTNQAGRENTHGSRFRLCLVASECNIPTGPAGDGEVEDYVVASGTLPVSLSHFDSALSGDTLKLDWGTASELFNSGFQLWGLDQASQQWQVLNQWLVASGGGNSAEPQSYSQSLSIPASITELESIGISSVDSDGSEHFYGPFEPGKAYGELLALEPIDWGEIRAQADTAMAALGYTRVHGQGYQLLASAANLSGDSAAQVTQFSVSGDGLYKLNAKQLLASGADWRDIPQGEIAVVNAQGQPISRHIVASGSGEGQDQTLGDRGYIVFYGQGVDQPSALYSGESVYRLQRDVSRVRRVPMQPRQGIGTQHSPSYIEQSWVEEQNHYLVNSVLADPWLSDVILSYPDRSRGALYTLPVEADAIADQGAKLLIRAGRSSALPLVDNNQDGLIDPEHILRGIVMTPSASPGYLLLDAHYASGRGAWSVDYSLTENLDLSAGQLRVGALFKAGAGYQFSEAYIDAVGIAYSRPYVAKAGDNHLSFSAPNQGESSYRVEVPRVSGLVIYASDGPNLVRLNNEALQFVRYADGRRAIRTSFAALQGANALGQSDSIRYWVANGHGYLSVKQIAPVQVRAQAELLDAASASDYLIIAHPSFMGESLTRFANHKRAMGHQVQVVDYLALVDSFAGGQSGPQGLTAYLRAVEQASGGALAHVLLVGGSTYDHRNYLASDAITFIPSHYGVTVHSRHTPSDSLYVQDANGDLFAAIGRWPVRSAAELETLVANTLQWDNQTIEAPSVLLIGDRTLEGEYIEFGQALDNLSAHLPSDYLQNKIYSNESLPATQAKPLIKAGLNQAPQLVVYNGHASTSRLGKDNLYHASDAADNQAASPALWLPLSCYMTYFESTSVNTLAHQLLFSGQTVAISGAALLASQFSNLSMGTAMLNGLDSGHSLGASLNQAKLGLNNSANNINWSLLGDPSIKLD